MDNHLSSVKITYFETSMKTKKLWHYQEKAKLDIATCAGDPNEPVYAPEPQISAASALCILSVATFSTAPSRKLVYKRTTLQKGGWIGSSRYSIWPSTNILPNITRYCADYANIWVFATKYAHTTIGRTWPHWWAIGVKFIGTILGRIMLA